MYNLYEGKIYSFLTGARIERAGHGRGVRRVSSHSYIVTANDGEISGAGSRKTGLILNRAV